MQTPKSEVKDYVSHDRLSYPRLAAISSSSSDSSKSGTYSEPDVLMVEDFREEVKSENGSVEDDSDTISDAPNHLTIEEPDNAELDFIS